MTKEHQSLRNFLRNHLLLLGVVLSAIFGWGMALLYEWGLDDSAEYYLYQDAKHAEQLVRNQQPLPKPTPFKKFYIGKSGLPTPISNALQHNLITDQLAFYQADNSFHYIYQHRISGNPNHPDRSLFVVHSYDEADELAYPGLTVLELILTISTAAIVIVCFSWLIIYRGIHLPLSEFYDWGKSINNPKAQPVLPQALRFNELITVGQALEHSLQEVLKLTEREKSLSRCLGHELRTPMTVIGAALDILYKKNLTDEVKQKLDKIRNANRKMLATSDTLLNLWHDKQQKYTPSPINVNALVTELVQDNLYLLQSNAIQFDNNIAASLVIRIQETPLIMIINNLLRNAIQYSSAGTITLTADTDSISIQNPVSPLIPENAPGLKEYGYGLGLLVAQSVAEQMGWRLTCSMQQGNFVANLKW